MGDGFSALLHDRVESREERRSVQGVDAMPALFFTGDNLGIEHQLKMSGDHGAILREMLSEGPNIRGTMEQQDLDELNSVGLRENSEHL